MKTYYKVLHRHQKKLISVTKWPNNKSVQYIRNKWTKSKDKNRLFLFVFDNLKDAENWSCTNNAIYECEIGNIIPYKIRLNITKTVDGQCIDGYMQNGAVLTDRVMITKRIK